MKHVASVFRLYFGANVPALRQRAIGFATVTAEHFERFLLSVVAPQVVGWTELPAKGGWLDATNGTIEREVTAVLEFWADDPDALRPILESIAAAYVRDFGQDAVGIIELPAYPVRFVTRHEALQGQITSTADEN